MRRMPPSRAAPRDQDRLWARVVESGLVELKELLLPMRAPTRYPWRRRRRRDVGVGPCRGELAGPPRASTRRAPSPSLPRAGLPYTMRRRSRSASYFAVVRGRMSSVASSGCGRCVPAPGSQGVDGRPVCLGGHDPRAVVRPRARLEVAVGPPSKGTQARWRSAGCARPLAQAALDHGAVAQPSPTAAFPRCGCSVSSGSDAGDAALGVVWCLNDPRALGGDQEYGRGSARRARIQTRPARADDSTVAHHKI